ncbi:MAG: aminomethyl-transferring glycine dehydrogenase subunit GcvPA [Acidobacteria bacterium]|nr:aminomethyl-transferring glycine dehydrogenase subunit GcvPA [Acidobacteriota bacterium]
MLRYISLTQDEKQQMLQTIGRENVEALFACIPENIRLHRPLNIPGPLSETEILQFFKQVAFRNFHANEKAYFLGAGAYNHFVPVVIDALVSRAEFYTAYTPYQPEVAQGTLQSIFEFQTLICQLTGLDVANASLYDGSTALAEALLMAERVRQRNHFVLSSLIHPQYRAVIATYTRNMNYRMDLLPYTGGGLTDLGTAEERLTDQSAALVVQYPNFLGNIEDVASAANLAHRCGAMLIVVVTEPIALGLLQAPGSLGADICVGEAQPLGLPLSFGGPYVGFFSTREDFKRHMPGRIVGETVDADGQRGFVLTLATREQHIRREKATSNICTNEALCALMSSIFMCILGKSGMRELARQNFSKAHYCATQLEQGGCSVAYGKNFFNELVVNLTRPVAHTNAHLAELDMIGGYDLSIDYPEMANQMLVCITDQNTREQIDRFVAALQAEKGCEHVQSSISMRI